MKPSWVFVGVGVVVAGWAAIALPARATYGSRTTADEPQYLLSALSLGEDGNLWIEDELSTERYRSFHEQTLPVQTEVLDNGHAVSPHDPLLPALLAVPMRLGGWEAAKATMAGLAGVLAALLTWVAHRRLSVPLGVASVTVLAFGLAAPLSAYGTQIYPELPAALAVTAALAFVLAPATGGQPAVAGARTVGFGVAVVALPWLGVKYAPVAAALALVGLARLWRAQQPRRLLGACAGLGLAAVVYAVVHWLIYGGWTVYAAGDHFVGGELTVVGNDPDYLGRTQRLAGLLLDRGFGLAAWMPGFLLIVPALAALLRRRPPGWEALVLPVAAGWATATWIALTMHGWWWPGRQTVVVVPCVVLAVAWWAGRQAHVRQWIVGAAGVVGAFFWMWLFVEVLGENRTLIVDFESTTNPLFRAWHALLPDYRHPELGDWVRQWLWLLALGAAAAWSVRRARPSVPLSVEDQRRQVDVPA